MVGAVRDITQYQWIDDAAERWPEWTFQASQLPGTVREVISPDTRQVTIDPARWKYGGRHGFAHALAHLDLGHHVGDHLVFSYADEADAETLAMIRLDVEGTRR